MRQIKTWHWICGKFVVVQAHSTFYPHHYVAPPQNVEFENTVKFGFFCRRGNTMHLMQEYTTGLLSGAKFHPDRRR